MQNFDANSTNVTEVRTRDERTYERKYEHYIPPAYKEFKRRTRAFAIVKM